jgi:hypothetical protein
VLVQKVQKQADNRVLQFEWVIERTCEPGDKSGRAVGLAQASAAVWPWSCGHYCSTDGCSSVTLPVERSRYAFNDKGIEVRLLAQANL